MSFFKRIFHRKRLNKPVIHRQKSEEKIFCPCCGFSNPIESNFCLYCGVELVTSSGEKIKITGKNSDEVNAVLTRYKELREESMSQKTPAIKKADMNFAPYIFISYAHKDKEIVLPLLSKLNEYGFRIWFDQNIEPASTWDDNIAEHIENAEFFVSMISPAYLDSQNCLDELRYALSQKKANKQFLLFIYDISLPKGIAMRTGGIQNLQRNAFTTDDNMISHFSKVKGIDVCIQYECENLCSDMDSYAKNLQKTASSGNSNAQFELGRCYYDGFHVSQSYSKAVYWYQKAADNGLAVAQHNLALCYESGVGTEKNDHHAFKWYQKAATQNHHTAQNHLGLCYDNGIGTEIDHVQAVYWYQKAAESGHAGAQFNLGISFQNGEGIKLDIDQAKKWLQLSAEQGEKRAQRALLAIALTEQNSIEDGDFIEVPKGKLA